MYPDGQTAERGKNIVGRSNWSSDVRENMANDEFPCNVHIRRESPQVSVEIIFLSLSFSNKLDRRLLKEESVQCIVLLNSIASFCQRHRISAYLYNVHIQNNHLDNKVHIVYNYKRSIDARRKEKPFHRRYPTEHVCDDLSLCQFCPDCSHSEIG